MQSTAQDESNSQWCVEIVDTVTNDRNTYYYEYFEHAEHHLINHYLTYLQNIHPNSLQKQEVNIHLHGCTIEQHYKANQAKRNANGKR